jgi:hypothetical protein
MKIRILFVSFLLGSWCISQHRLLVFSNGYISPFKDNIPRNNGVTQKSQGYWYGYDDTICKRFQPIIPIYISGHHPLRTSVHRYKFRFIGSCILTKFVWFQDEKGFALNHAYNPIGFMIRYGNGELCGRNFVQFVKDSLKSNPKNDTLDIVCHSMGYAYTLGFLNAVDTFFTLGKLLILSPESPGFLGYDWNRFMEVWQYGSNLGEKNSDIICLQDGIAPQGPVKGIEKLNPT